MRQRSPESYEEKLSQLNELREQKQATRPQAEEKQHGKGKLTARERVGSCSIPAPSRSSTPSSATARTTSTCRSTGPGATPSSPATA